MYELTEDDKKRLTEFLGEKWHLISTDFDNASDGWLWSECVCGDRWCDNSISKRHRTRTFTTWEDLGALKEKLVGEEKWGDFMELAYDRWDTREDPCLYSWLLHPTRFAWLVKEFLKGGSDGSDKD